jgi:exopolyphosphatase/guanosine-5'-triphosphate,3'-diphosphate pyrophosphatase
VKLFVTPQLNESICHRQRVVERWVARRLGTVVHEQRVKEIALKLFDLTWPLHGLRSADRRLLALAAVVHDVGRSIDDDTHPQEGRKMLERAEHLPISSGTRRALMYLTRYHRGDVPPAKADNILRRDDDHRTLRILLALLRAADSLDSRTIQSPRLVFAMRDRRLHIACYLDEDTSRARKVYGRRKKLRLLEELLECRVELHIVQAQLLQMVA